MTTCEYNQPLDLCEGVRVEFVDAGHLLGSASILVTATEGGITKQIVFSGDIGNVDQPIIRDPTYLTGADYVVMESTYGDRNHTEVWSYTDDLAKIIDETIAKGGNVVIPLLRRGPHPGAAVLHPGDQGQGDGEERPGLPRVHRLPWPRRPPPSSPATCGAIWMRRRWSWCRTAPTCSTSPTCA